MTNKQVRPGMSTEQMKVLRDPSVTFVGIDSAGRPVVSKPEKGYGKDNVVTWALKRNGYPTDVTFPINRDANYLQS